MKKKEINKEKPVEKKLSKSVELLKCDFTEDEKKENATTLARIIKERERAVLAKKAVAKKMEEDIARLDLDVSGYAEKVTNGYEYREVPTERLIDYKEDRFTATRMDTKDVIEDRPLRDHEKQLPMED